MSSDDQQPKVSASTKHLFDEAASNLFAAATGIRSDAKRSVEVSVLSNIMMKLYIEVTESTHVALFNLVDSGAVQIDWGMTHRRPKVEGAPWVRISHKYRGMSHRRPEVEVGPWVRISPEYRKMIIGSPETQLIFVGGIDEKLRSQLSRTRTRQHRDEEQRQQDILTTLEEPEGLKAIDDTTIDLNIILNIMGPPPDMAGVESSELPNLPVSIS